MEAFRSLSAYVEALGNGDILAWIISVVVLILVIRTLKKASKWMLITLTVFAAIFGVNFFYPELLEPVVHFVKGGWLGDDDYYGIE